MPRLEGKVAIITGAGTGVGRSCLQIFAREGAKVVGAGRTQATLDESLAAVTDAGGEGFVQTTDVSNEEDCSALIRAAVDRYGQLDIIINNASVGFDYATEARPDAMNSLAETSAVHWETVIAINLNSVFYMSKPAIAEMRKTGGGAIVNVSSMGGEMGMPAAHAYTAAKAGVNNLTRSMAVSYGPENIRTNCVAPGGIDTKMVAGWLEAAGNPHLDDEVRHTFAPLGRLAHPDEIANACLFFASDESSYCNGSVLLVDGGSTATWNTDFGVNGAGLPQ
jgi:NAD(P)-dependent dehydrogenase (short-subunit alcohol dehydrogenase family)